MFTWTRVVRFKNSASMLAGMPICLEVVGYWKKKFGQEISLLAPAMGGAPARVAFILATDDLNDSQQKFDEASKDKKYIDILKRLGEYVDGSTTNDQVWKKIV